jgi:hypothetical protein
VAYNKPAIFKTSVLNHLTEAQSCVRFAGSEHRAERQAANLREYEDRFRETARLMNKTERHLLEATGKVERADVVLIPEESQFERARKRFQRLDRNNDQRITFDEWMAEELEEAA